jgi:hypothetical protein
MKLYRNNEQSKTICLYSATLMIRLYPLDHTSTVLVRKKHTHH